MHFILSMPFWYSLRRRLALLTEYWCRVGVSVVSEIVHKPELPVTPDLRMEVDEEARCDVCGSSSHRFLFRGPDRLMGLPGEFSFVRCTNCGLIYQWPRLPWEQLAAYYEGDYASYSTLLDDDPIIIRRLLRRLGGLKQRWYVERFKRGGSLLDVGCGTGLFLREMQHAGSWQLSGVEPTTEAAAYVRRRLNIPVYDELFEDAPLLPASQDVITLWHVLEHVPSPTATLQKAWQVLKPGGFLIASVPNYESIARRAFGRYWIGWDLPRHTYIIPRPLLSRMFRDVGFEVVDSRCFQISYASFGHSLSFWTQSWPVALRSRVRWLRAAYYNPLTRAALYPFQILVERLGLATVVTWAVQKPEMNAAH